MERFGLFRFQRLQFFLLAKLASDFAERSSGSRRVRVDVRLRILRCSGRAIIFLRALGSLGFDLRAIFRSQNLRVLEIFFGVNTLGVFLYFLFAGAFLTGGFGDGWILLILRARNGGAESREAQKQDGRCGEVDGARDPPCACATRLEGPEAV